MPSGLGPAEVDVRVNVGIHWGATLMVGQVATGGRLEGIALASKHLLERLGAAEAAELGIDPDDMTYRTVAEIAGRSEKAVRDAGAISVAAI